ncbi:pyruvate dehydrogenase complex dihydrolipoamide acetyltransferase [Parvibaculum sp.]|uniref:pyruvate dehydrogenase complex dihydrolipoamide acetyltransferase n=1 Tax=Parvibaculum sp. TaxID=2024848 RepID=UPI001D533322|nr:pyruvate dehydrogenase complex dihydrolipoamide acetyltransferase [Parvibaculum sp.]MBX3487824.1 pyruvate dehydrogenase complex dihydrolipoamide acetyltransferase [Parvibaculum sp.]MCW5728184.1 pyruvate dehydrogenase complex dihydrolipoamide acetyltransferase [Parvibaculum sp.]
MPIDILMPALSPTMEEGTLAKWLVKEGDEVKSGDIIAEIETDKATMEVEAVDEGRIGKLLVAEGTEGVAVNKPIAILLEEGESASDVKAPEKAKAPEKPKPAEKSAAPEVPKPAAKSEAKPAPPAPANGKSGRVFASPLARRIAAQKGIDLSSVEGSGPRGRIVKADIESAKPGARKSAAPAPAPASAIDARAFYAEGTYEEIPLDGMRKTIARRLTQSMQEIPHFYLTVDCELDELLATRKKLNAEAGEGAKLSVNDFLIRAAALALVKVPMANVSFAGNALLKHTHADIGIAVALDGGLITPIVRAAETKGLAEISAEAKSLAARARDKKLKPSEFEGGSFSISNLGMYGIKHFTAVINPPQAAILAVGKGEERPVVHDGKLEVATVMTVTMSCDHRAIDGALGAQFLEAFKSFVEYPARMLL